MIGAPIPCAATVIRPTAAQRALAYLRTGSLPPVLATPALALEAALSFGASTALCLAAGYLLGSAIAP